MFEISLAIMSFSAGALVSLLIADRTIMNQRKRYEQIMEMQNEELGTVLSLFERLKKEVRSIQ